VHKGSSKEALMGAEEAGDEMEMAYDASGIDDSKIIVMPQGANALLLLE